MLLEYAMEADNTTLKERIMDSFGEERFAKFCEYCKANGKEYLHQLERIDFLLFKITFNAGDDERNAAETHWTKIINDKSLKPSTRAKIIAALGEEMYDACMGNPDKNIVLFRLLKLAVAEIEQAGGIDSEYLNRLIAVKNVLGEEFCIWCLKNYKGVSDLINILSPYAEAYEDMEKTRKKVNRLFDALDANNQDVILAEWLDEGKKATLKNELIRLFKKDRDEGIIRKRAAGATLEETCMDYNISRERVRQIERKLQKRFDSYISRLNPHYILYAFSKNRGYLSVDAIKELFGDLADIFIYCLQKCNCSSAHWSDELKGFIVGDRVWYQKLKDYIEELPEMLEIEVVDDKIAEIINKITMPIAIEDVRRIVLSAYSLSGKVYLKRRLRLFRMYHAVLAKYYPDGIKLYDGFELRRFRGYVRELFGDVKLPANDRAIYSRLIAITVLCNRAKYILPGGINISEGLLQKINAAIIESDRDVIMIKELFERFKDELLEHSNITNRYFLQGALKQNYSAEFYFTRDALYKRGRS